MKIIALTGGIGSGKSYIADEFQKLGAYTMDADKIYHELIQPGQSTYNEIVKSFGTGILKDNLEIDRKKLGDIVFGNPKELEKLNNITHKSVYDEINRRVNTLNKDVYCIEIPLLFSAECSFEYDISVAVTAPLDERIRRVVKRDKCTEKKVLERISSQLTDDVMCEKADCVIVNYGDLEAVKKQVKEVYDRLV